RSASRGAPQAPERVRCPDVHPGMCPPSAATPSETVSCRLSFKGLESLDDLFGALPFLFCSGKISLAVLRYSVKPGFPLVIRDSPFGGDGTLLFQLQEYGIERSGVDRQAFTARLFDAPSDAIAMLGPEHIQCFQYHQGQGSLPDFTLVLRHLGIPNEILPALIWENKRNAEALPISGDAIMPPPKLSAACRAELPGPLCSVTPTAKPNSAQRYPDSK